MAPCRPQEGPPRWNTVLYRCSIVDISGRGEQKREDLTGAACFDDVQLIPSRNLLTPARGPGGYLLEVFVGPPYKHPCVWCVVLLFSLNFFLL